MRGQWAGLAAAFFAVGLALPAKAEIKVDVDVGAQKMDVYVDGEHWHSWPVSTGRDGYETPTGSFKARRIEEEWYSTQYDDAPMPHAIFFSGGYAIHGTYHTKALGRPASHGCVRLSPSNAAKLYDLVESHGLGHTKISIYD